MKLRRKTTNQFDYSNDLIMLCLTTSTFLSCLNMIHAQTTNNLAQYKQHRNNVNEHQQQTSRLRNNDNQNYNDNVELQRIQSIQPTTIGDNNNNNNGNLDSSRFSNNFLNSDTHSTSVNNNNNNNHDLSHAQIIHSPNYHHQPTSSSNNNNNNNNNYNNDLITNPYDREDSINNDDYQAARMPFDASSSSATSVNNNDNDNSGDTISLASGDMAGNLDGSSVGLDGESPSDMSDNLNNRTPLMNNQPPSSNSNSNGAGGGDMMNINQHKSRLQAMHDIFERRFLNNPYQLPSSQGELSPMSLGLDAVAGNSGPLGPMGANNPFQLSPFSVPNGVNFNSQQDPDQAVSLPLPGLKPQMANVDAIDNNQNNNNNNNINGPQPLGAPAIPFGLNPLPHLLANLQNQAAAAVGGGGGGNGGAFDGPQRGSTLR